MLGSAQLNIAQTNKYGLKNLFVLAIQTKRSILYLSEVKN